LASSEKTSSGWRRHELICFNSYNSSPMLRLKRLKCSALRDFLGSCHTTPSQLTTASFGWTQQDGFVSAEAFAEELAGKSQVGPWDLGWSLRFYVDYWRCTFIVT
jgi:hypothetical protein